ncbi:MAG: hypothetical protein C0401_09640, partial [Anaerolinea sp.]|nr:hypothetical protein [Anaerolinea sp.]
MFSYRTLLRILNRIVYIGSAAMLMAGLVLTVAAKPAVAVNENISICHETGSASNPYASNTVSPNSVASALDWASGHGGHLADPTATPPKLGDIWPSFVARNGDVIPAYGNQAILANGCNLPSQPAITVTKIITSTGPYSVGSSITYSIRVLNSGDAALTGVTITDPGTVVGTCSPAQPASLAPSAMMTCPATHVVTQGDLNAGSYTNTATGDSNETPSSTASAIATFVQSPSISILKSETPPGGTYLAGDTINYTIVVTNTGNITLTGVTVSDSSAVVGVCSPTQPASLAPAATMTCPASHLVTQDDIEAQSYTNTATGDSDQTGEVTSSVEIPFSPRAVLSVLKTETSSANRPYILGETITYDIVATNVGQLILTGVNISDSGGALGTCTPAQPATLNPGATLTCSASHVVVQADVDAGSYTNIGTGDSAQTELLTSSVTVPISQSPQLSLLKTAAPGSYNAVDDVISYSYKLTNNGNVTLSGPFTVSDDKALVTCPGIASLAPAAFTTCTASYTITQPDLDAGSVTNLATAHALFGTTPVDSNQDSETVDATQSPDLILLKTALPVTYNAVDDVISYSYKLTNNGNVTLSGAFSVEDDKATVTCPAVSSLAPGAFLTCTASYTITQADLDAGSVTNNAQASAGSVLSNVDSETVNAVQNPALSIDKDVAEANYSAVDDVLHYTYLVTNTGNVTLDGAFTVTDDMAVDESCPGALTLAPDDSITCTATYTIAQADLDRTWVTNVASAHGYFERVVVNSLPDEVTVHAYTLPGLAIDKTVIESSFSAVGDILHYSYEVTNTGNVTLEGDFTITDDKSTDAACPDTDTLAPLASITCTGTYAITQEDLDLGEVTNIASAHGWLNDGAVDSETDTVTVTAVQTAALSIDKNALETEFNLEGELLNYTYLVTNTGNVTLEGPFTITDDKSTDATCPVTATLAPLGQILCSGTYTVTLLDLVAGSITNIASAHALFEKEPVDSETDTVTVVAPPLVPVSVLDPYCVVENGVDKMEWVVLNPNLRPFIVASWLVDGEKVLPGFMLLPGVSYLTRTGLGTHRVDLQWDGGSDNLTFTIDTCGLVPPVIPPVRIFAPLPIPETGGAGGEILIPVTGADLTPGMNGFMFGGITLLGIGMVLSGLRKRY